MGISNDWPLNGQQVASDLNRKCYSMCRKLDVVACVIVCGVLLLRGGGAIHTNEGSISRTLCRPLFRLIIQVSPLPVSMD